jgi:hypothetical protein
LFENPLHHARADAELPANLEHTVARGLQFENPKEVVIPTLTGLPAGQECSTGAVGWQGSQVFNAQPTTGSSSKFPIEHPDLHKSDF